MTIEQARMKVADACWDAIQPDKRREAKSVLLGFGASVQRCGLLQALAFLRRDAHEAVGNAVSTRVREHLQAQGMMSAGGGELVTKVKGLDDAAYMLVTREVIALSVWLKRAAQAPGATP